MAKDKIIMEVYNFPFFKWCVFRSDRKNAVEALLENRDEALKKAKRHALACGSKNIDLSGKDCTKVVESLVRDKDSKVWKKAA